MYMYKIYLHVCISIKQSKTKGSKLERVLRSRHCTDKNFTHIISLSRDNPRERVIIIIPNCFFKTVTHISK